MADSGDGIERVYRRRRKLPWRYLGLVGLVFLNAMFQAWRTWDDPYAPHWGTWLFGLFTLVTIVRICLEQFRAHTRVTAEGVTTQGNLRSRTWAWDEVYDIRVVPAPRGSGGMAPQWPPYLYALQGRRFLLPHIDDWQLDDLHTEVSDLCLAAAPAHSLGWERRPQVEERILRRAARRKAWTWAGNGALIALFAMFVLSIGLVATGRPDNLFLLFVVVPLVSFGVFGVALQWYWSARPPRSLAGQA